MYIVPIAWLYVTMMMAVAEATSPVGSVLGAVVTFLLYGLGPAALVGYILGTPARRRAARMSGPPNDVAPRVSSPPADAASPATAVSEPAPESTQPPLT